MRRTCGITTNRKSTWRATQSIMAPRDGDGNLPDYRGTLHDVQRTSGSTSRVRSMMAGSVTFESTASPPTTALRTSYVSAVPTIAPQSETASSIHIYCGCQVACLALTDIHTRTHAGMSITGARNRKLQAEGETRAGLKWRQVEHLAAVARQEAQQRGSHTILFQAAILRHQQRPSRSLYQQISQPGDVAPRHRPLTVTSDAVASRCNWKVFKYVAETRGEHSRITGNGAAPRRAAQGAPARRSPPRARPAPCPTAAASWRPRCRPAAPAFRSLEVSESCRCCALPHRYAAGYLLQLSQTQGAIGKPMQKPACEAAAILKGIDASAASAHVCSANADEDGPWAADNMARILTPDSSTSRGSKVKMAPSRWHARKRTALSAAAHSPSRKASRPSVSSAATVPTATGATDGTNATKRTTRSTCTSLCGDMMGRGLMSVQIMLRESPSCERHTAGAHLFRSARCMMPRVSQLHPLPGWSIRSSMLTQEMTHQNVMRCIVTAMMDHEVAQFIVRAEAPPPHTHVFDEHCLVGQLEPLLHICVTELQVRKHVVT